MMRAQLIEFTAPSFIPFKKPSAMPRGGAVHARCLAEALAARGHDVELWVLTIGGSGLRVGPGVATHQMPLRPVPDESVADRVDRAAATLAGALRGAPPVDINHAQDLLSARAMLALRADGEVFLRSFGATRPIPTAIRIARF